MRAARAVDYTGAGTVEFLYEDGEFYFLEMNTRLQVEHPVTEFVTGVDLVEWQFRVAAGEALPMRQAEIPLRGHAIECRVTSESPFDGFLPANRHGAPPRPSRGADVRWDGGIAAGNEIGLHYDPLLGKLIVRGRDRASAIRRMKRALAELRIVGVDTGVPLLRRILDEPDFLAGRLSTAYLAEHPGLFDTHAGPTARTAAVAAAAPPRARAERCPGGTEDSQGRRAVLRLARRDRAVARAGAGRTPVSVQPGTDRSASRYVVSVAGETHEVVVGPGAEVVIDGPQARGLAVRPWSHRDAHAVPRRQAGRGACDGPGPRPVGARPGRREA